MNETALRALALPSLGRVLELAPLREPGMSDPQGRDWRQVMRTGDALAGMPPLGENDVTGFEEIVTASTHLGCHLDAPGARHIAGVASGMPYAEFYGNDGLRALGADALRPVLTRGILLDGATDVHFEHIEPGDAVLIRGGITEGLAEDLAARDAGFIGLETAGCDRDLPLPVISNLLLDELASAATGPFLLVLTPIRGDGSTGAPVSPLAIL